MTLEETIADRLVAIHAALVEKTGEQPFVRPAIRFESEAKITLYRAFAEGEDYIVKTVLHPTIMGALDAADAFIAAMPNPELAKKKDAMRVYGRAVDGLRDAGFGDEIVTPAAATLQAISKNLLPHEAA